MTRSPIDVDALLANASLAFAVLDDQGKLVAVNRAFRAILGDVDADPAVRRLAEEQLLAKPQSLSSAPRRATRLWRKSNPPAWIEVIFIPLADAEGRALATACFCVAGAEPSNLPEDSESAVAERLARIRENQRETWGFEAHPAQGPAIRRAIDQASLAVGQAPPVAIVGPPGVGKRELARWIHERSAFSRGPFVVLDAEALPEETIREQLLGVDDVDAGLLRAPGPGTFYVRQASALPVDLQRRLLDAFRDPGRRWRLMIGEREPLESAWRDERWDEAFYYFATTLTIALPALRERAAEMSDICHWILDDLARQAGSGPRLLDADALALLQLYDWPGNVRELQAVLEAAQLRNPGAKIRVEDLPRRFRRAEAAEPSAAADSPSLDRLLEEVERRLLKQALRRYRGNKSKAAEHLKISRARLHRRCEQWGVDATDG